MQQNNCQPTDVATVDPPRRADRKMFFDLEIWSNPGGQMACAKRLRVRLDTEKLGPEIEMKLHVAE